jgi:uncharacterized protein (TIGR04255 family)
MPYSGWAKFKEIICIVFSVLRDVPFVSEIDRHSLKYVDFIVANGTTSLTRFNVALQVAGKTLSHQPTQLRTELTEPPFLHAVSIISDATVVKPGETPVRGSVVEADTHRIESLTVAAFLENLENLLNQMHESNKSLFFDLISPDCLKELEPIYG